MTASAARTQERGLLGKPVEYELTNVPNGGGSSIEIIAGTIASSVEIWPCNPLAYEAHRFGVDGQCQPHEVPYVDTYF